MVVLKTAQIVLRILCFKIKKNNNKEIQLYTATLQVLQYIKQYELTVHILVEGAVIVVGMPETEGVSVASDDSSEVYLVAGDSDDVSVLLPGSVVLVETDVERAEVTGAEEAVVFTSSGPGVDFPVNAEVASGVGRRADVGTVADVLPSVVDTVTVEVAVVVVGVMVVVISGRATVDVRVTTGLVDTVVVCVGSGSSVLVVSSVITDLTVVRGVWVGDTDSDVVGELGGVLTVDVEIKGGGVDSVVVVLVVVDVVDSIILAVVVPDTGGTAVEGVTLDVVRGVVVVCAVCVVVGLTLVVALSVGVLGLEVVEVDVV